MVFLSAHTHCVALPPPLRLKSLTHTTLYLEKRQTVFSAWKDVAQEADS